jgi:uracil-DNA glycosylase
VPARPRARKPAARSTTRLGQGGARGSGTDIAAAPPVGLLYDAGCTICPRLARYLADARARHPDYHALPVPPFGAARPRLLVVGLAPGYHGANRTGRPFTGDHAGLLLYETLHAYGFANRAQAVAAGDGLALIDCRIANAVNCAPPGNAPTGDEVRNCNVYLRGQLALLPPRAVILALGRTAHDAVLLGYGLARATAAFAHGAEHRLGEGIVLLDSYHCSRYNTQTRRLTPGMFRDVVARARVLVDGIPQ